jgi:iron complex transport system ATP-binding protein
MTELTAENLSVRRSGATILDKVSLSFKGNGSVAIIGPNGAGKSTLLKMLSGLEKPQTGAVLFDGRNIHTVPQDERTRKIGYLPQSFAPYWDHRVEDLLELGVGRAQIVRAGVIDRLARAHELDEFLKRRWSTLSGGERARVLLAMVLAIEPEILLADEPGASLDIRHRLDLLSGLVRRAKAAMVVVVLHDLDLAIRFFDRIVLMNDGRIVFDGAGRDIFADERLDATFSVRFRRLEIDGNAVLYPVLFNPN